MKELLLIRFKESDEGTQGLLILDDHFYCYTLELPWRRNQPYISCIPIGKYKCVPHKYKGKTQSFELLDVPSRSTILIHPGNLAGDIKKGYKSDVAGCILVGRKFGKINKQLAVLQSRFTLKNLIRDIGWNEFYLIIEDIHPSKYIFEGDYNDKYITVS